MKVKTSQTKALYHSHTPGSPSHTRGRVPARDGALARWPIPDERVLVPALALVTLAGLVLLLGHKGYDDPYITYRYAANLLHGRGFVYNEGQRVLSTTAPLYALLLAGLGLIWRDLALLSNVIGAASLVAGTLVLHRLAVKRSERAVGLIVLLLMPVSSLLTRTFGAETCLYVALIVAALYAYDRSSWTWTAVLLGLATAIRADGLLAVAVLTIYHLARGQRPPWRAVVVYAAVVGVWLAGLWLYFGSPIPVTLAAKQHQGQLAITTDFAGGLVDLARSYLRLPVFWLHALVAAIGLGRVLARQRHWLPLLLWTALYIVAYSLLRVGTYFWYYGPLLPALIVLLAEGIVALVRGLLSRRVPRAALAAGAAVLVVVFLLSLLWESLWYGSRADARFAPSQETGRWLAQHTPPDAAVGTLEIGVIGYYADRGIVDFAGLLQPDIARQLTTTATYEDSAWWAIDRYQPEYVVLPGGALLGLVNNPAFRAAYAPIKTFTENGTFSLVIYQQGADPLVGAEPLEPGAQPNPHSSLSWREQADLFLSRLEGQWPYPLGHKVLTIGWGAIYAVAVGVFLVKLGEAMGRVREEEL